MSLPVFHFFYDKDKNLIYKVYGEKFAMRMSKEGERDEAGRALSMLEKVLRPDELKELMPRIAFIQIDEGLLHPIQDIRDRVEGKKEERPQPANRKKVPRSSRAKLIR